MEYMETYEQPALRLVEDSDTAAEDHSDQQCIDGLACSPKELRELEYGLYP